MSMNKDNLNKPNQQPGKGGFDKQKGGTNQKDKTGGTGSTGGTGGSRQY